MYYRAFSSSPGLDSLDASNSHLTPSCDNHFQSLSNVPQGTEPQPYPQHCSRFLRVSSLKQQLLKCSEKMKVSMMGGDSPLGQTYSHMPTERVWEVLQRKNLLIFSGPRTGQLYLTLRSLCDPANHLVWEGLRCAHLPVPRCPQLTCRSRLPVGCKARGLVSQLPGGRHRDSSSASWTLTPVVKLDIL